jgi:thioredoxin-dependent peroxiredoxin
MLEPGQAAPQFSLPDADMEDVSLAKFKSRKNVVLYFYAKDGTPARTLTAIEFSDLEAQFAKEDCVVMGISCDDCITHAEFRDQNGLSVTLLADAEGEVCRKYGVWRDPESAGQRRSCVLRSTFVIDKKGLVRHALYGITPRGHAEEVLELVRGLRA